MKVKDKLLNIFKRNTGRYLTYAEIRDYFDREEIGANSIDRHKRFLKEDGWDIEKRHIKHNTYGYRLVGKKVPMDMFV